MPSGRGVLVFGAGIALWVAARMLGSPTLHMVSVGIVLLPFAAALFARWSRQRLRIRRRLSDTRVQPGQRLEWQAQLDVGSAADPDLVDVVVELDDPLGRRAGLVARGETSRRDHTQPKRH